MCISYVLVEFGDTDVAIKALNGMTGRKINGEECTVSMVAPRNHRVGPNHSSGKREERMSQNKPYPDSKSCLMLFWILYVNFMI